MLIYSILLFNLLKPLNINIILLDFNYLWIFSFFFNYKPQYKYNIISSGGPNVY